jgi:hypothetical protein
MTTENAAVNMADEAVVVVGDWVRLPNNLGGGLANRFGRVTKVKGNQVTLNVLGMGEVVCGMHILIKVVWSPTAPLREVSDDGPFCPCGEPVSVPGQACRECRREELRWEMTPAG